jgi:hypothetical protein
VKNLDGHQAAREPVLCAKDLPHSPRAYEALDLEPIRDDLTGGLLRERHSPQW